MVLQPAKQALDHVPLSILGFVEQPRQTWLWLALHCAIGNDWLHAIAIAILPEWFGVITLVCYELTASFAGPTPACMHLNAIKQRLGMRDITGLPAGKSEMQWHTSSVANHMNFRR